MRMAECALDRLKGAHVGMFIPDTWHLEESSRDHSVEVLGDLTGHVDDPAQFQQFSKLLNRRLIDEAYRSTIGALGTTNADVDSCINQGSISVNVQPDEGNEWLNIRFCRQADSLFDCDGVKPFLEQQDIDRETHRLDVMLRSVCAGRI
jgi:hypothetical protein